MTEELKQAAQQALEQLEFLNACYPHKTATDASDALRRALTQRPAAQTEREAFESAALAKWGPLDFERSEVEPEMYYNQRLDDAWIGFGFAVAWLRASLPATQQATPEPVGEPVGTVVHATLNGQAKPWVTVALNQDADLPNGTKLYTRPAPGVPALTKDQIRTVFLTHGFTVKEGQSDLKPYVYDAAEALLKLASPAPGVPELTSEMVNAAHQYLNRFKHWPGLPDQFRWHELWDAMLAAAQAKGGV